MSEEIIEATETPLTPATERVWSYLTPEEKRQLRIRLAAMNITVSSWIRSIILQFLETPMEL